MADHRGNPQPARSTRPLSLAPSYAVLCAVQAATVLAARPPAGRGRLGIAGVLLPAAALGLGVGLLRLGGAHTLAYVGAIGTPLLAAAGPRRLPLAAALWLVAWKANGLVAQAASVALIALAAITVARLIARVAPDWSIAAGLVVIAVVDVVLVWGTRQVRAGDRRAARRIASIRPPPAGRDLRLGDDGLARPARAGAPRHGRRRCGSEPPRRPASQQAPGASCSRSRRPCLRPSRWPPH